MIDENADFDVIFACDTEEELAAAARALGDDQIADQAAFYVEEVCRVLEYPQTPICPPAPSPTPEPLPTPEPTPPPLPVGEDTAFKQHALNVCQAARPPDLYSITAAVASADPAVLAAVDGVYVRLVEYVDFDGVVAPEPNLQRGYVYGGEIHRQVEFAADADVIACIALHAFEREQWYPEYQSGCPCSSYDASDAIVWMVEPVGATLVGEPWRTAAADVDGGEGTSMLLGGVDGGTGIRPPEVEDIKADIEVFLGA